MVVINQHVWKASKLSRTEFLQRIKSVKAIRVDEMLCNNQETTGFPVISYFPSSLELWRHLERFHQLVNEANFSVLDERSEPIQHIFAVILPPKLTTWLLHVEVETLKQQILNWLAGWTTFHSSLPDKQVTSLPPEIRKEVERIKEKYYGKRFSFDEFWGKSHPNRPQELLKHYEEVSKTLTGAAPPEFLKLRVCDLNTVDVEEWGLQRRQFGDWLSLSFPYRFGFMYDRDWEKIVVRGEADHLVRAESSDELWQKWLHTFELFPKTKNHLFGVVGTEVQVGSVYLFRGEELGRYKLGFHGGSDPFGRRGALQTGSAEVLNSAGHFRGSKKTEETVKAFFETKRVRPGGEWFALTEEEVTDLLDEAWRNRNNIF